MEQQQDSRLVRHFKEHTNPPVFFISAAVILAFVAWGVFAAGSLGTVANAVFGWIGTYAGWWYILSVSFFVILAFVLMFSKWGRIKLGPDDARPEFSTFAWFSMLFTAGMGIGLVFYGVNEPLTHFQSPPTGEGGTPAAAQEAMNLTYFHWGLHPWAVYIILGLGLGYFAFRRGLPMRPASAFYPLIGERIHGPIGHAVDILAVFGTLFGLATSLGLGASQISSGLNIVFGAPDTTLTQVLIIAALTAVAVTSVMFGIDRGIRRLSLTNMYLAIVLAVVVFFVGAPLFVLQFMTGSIGTYLQSLPQTSFQMFAFSESGSEWLQSWTLFYWGWWISWSPFVGMFIARISYGLTIRKFIAGAMIAPTLASMVWFSIFGGNAFYRVLNNLPGAQALADSNNTSAMFRLMEALPLGGIFATVFSLLAIIVVAIFFATSSDSGSLVVDILTNGGDPNPDWRQRLFWAITEGAVGAILLVAGAAAGGDPLGALQTAAVAAGLPFSVVLVLVAIGLLKGLSQEKVPGMEPETVPPEPGRAASRPRGAPVPSEARAYDHQERGQNRS